MLPDFPLIKREIARIYNERLRQSHDIHMGLSPRGSSLIIHEGGHHVLIRRDESVARVSPKRFSVSADLKRDPMDHDRILPKQAFEMMDLLGERLAIEKKKSHYELLEKELKRIGHVTNPDLPGIEQLFEALEKRHLDFDEEGNPYETRVHAFNLRYFGDRRARFPRLSGPRPLVDVYNARFL